MPSLKLMTGTIEIESACVRFEEHPSRNEVLIAHAEDLAALSEAQRIQVFAELENKSGHLRFMRRKYASLMANALGNQDAWPITEK